MSQKVVKKEEATNPVINGLASVLKKLKVMDFPINSKGKESWLKKDVKGLEGCTVCCTTPNHDMLLNIKSKGQRWGLFFNNEKDFESFYELIAGQKDKIMKFLRTLEVVNDTVSSTGEELDISI